MTRYLVMKLLCTKAKPTIGSNWKVIRDGKASARKKVTFTLKFLEINPLSTNIEYTPHDTGATSDSCNSRHSENYESLFTFTCKTLQIGIQHFVIWLIHSLNCVTNSISLKGGVG